MQSINNLGQHPSGLPILADNLIEFHASRLLMLINLCGTKNRIDGLTKMAKLDFFVRYPQFFATACKELDIDQVIETNSKVVNESAMIRFHYGPWDKRYYNILAYLKSRELIAINIDKNTVKLSLTEFGKNVSDKLCNMSAFHNIVDHMLKVKKVLGGKSGKWLKEFVYKTFDEEVARISLGEVIKT